MEIESVVCNAQGEGVFWSRSRSFHQNHNYNHDHDGYLFIVCFEL